MFDKIKKIFSHNKTEKKKEEKTNHMRLSSILLIGFRNISINRLRSFLTIGGVAIGIGIVTFLISLGFGVQEMVIKEVTQNNPKEIIDISNKNLENFVLLDDETLNKIKNISGVDRVELITSIGGKFVRGESQTDVVMYGVSEGYMKIANVVVSDGNIDDISKSESVFITTKLAQVLGFENAKDAIGSEVSSHAIITADMKSKTIGEEVVIPTENNEGQKLKVVGIVKDDSNSNSIYAYVLLGELRKAYGPIAGQGGKVSIHDITLIEGIRGSIEQMGFITESVIDTVNDINSFFTLIRIVLVVFGVIIMSISAMGMLNTLSVSLLQRTKEVGILKALGAKRGDIFKLFIFEAILISFSGGFIGLVGGYAFAKGVNFATNVFAAKYGVSVTNFIYVPSAFVFSIVGFIVFLGFVTGILPAIRAANIHALEALRYE